MACLQDFFWSDTGCATRRGGGARREGRGTCLFRETQQTNNEQNHPTDSMQNEPWRLQFEWYWNQAIFLFFFIIWILTMTRGMKSPDVQNELKHSLLTRRDSLWVVIFMTWIKSIHDIQLLDVLFCRLQLWYVHVWHFSLNKYRTVHAAWPVLVWFLVHITSYKIIRK